MRYRNVRTGRVLERPSTDEWLEASSGWERVGAPTSVESLLDEDDLAVIAAEDDNESEDTE